MATQYSWFGKKEDNPVAKGVGGFVAGIGQGEVSDSSGDRRERESDEREDDGRIGQVRADVHDGDDSEEEKDKDEVIQQRQNVGLVRKGKETGKGER